MKRFQTSSSLRTTTTRCRKSRTTRMSHRHVLLTLCRYKIGDSFFSLPVPEVQDLLSESVGKLNEDVSSLEDKLGELRSEMQDLKAALYGRFGKSINLEA